MKPLFSQPQEHLLMKATSSSVKMRKRLEYITRIFRLKEIFANNVLMPETGNYLLRTIRP